MARIELATSPLPRECSATELHGQAPSCQKTPLQTINLESALQNYQITINNNFSRLFTCFQTRYQESGGAGEGNRTLVVSLEGFCSTIELHPPPGNDLNQSETVTLHWISHCISHRTIAWNPIYDRILRIIHRENAEPTVSGKFRCCLVEGEGFEPSKAEPSDLQSDPFDRSGTPPNETSNCEGFKPVSQRGFQDFPLGGRDLKCFTA